MSDWKLAESTPALPLTLTLHNDHRLIVTQGQDKVLELITLSDAKRSVKGIHKGAAILLVINKGDKGSRKVRMKLDGKDGMTDLQQSEDFVSCLSAYFPFNEKKEKNEEPVCDLDNDSVAISEMAKLIVEGDPRHVLGEVYKNAKVPDDQLRHIVKLCFTDPEFPAFVGQVEKSIKDITDIY